MSIEIIISKWGNSQGLRLPKEVIKDIGVSIGDKVKLLVKNHKVIIEPIEKKKEYLIEELVQNIPSDYSYSEEEFDHKFGVEEW